MILNFLLLVILGSFFVMGFYTITRGHTVVRPDNVLVTEGKLLKRWSVYFTSIRGYKPYFYTGNELHLKFQELQATKRFKDSLVCTDTSLYINEGFLSGDDQEFIEKRLRCTVIDKRSCFCLCQYLPTFVFPEWVRNWLSECPPCMASSFGSLFWWLIYFIVNNYYNFGVDWTMWAALWIPYIMSVCFVNLLLTKLTKS